MNNKRLLAILSYIDSNDKVVDVGCDHAYLSKMLAKKNISSIASDINIGIIKNLKKQNKNPLIKYVVSDGLKNINDNYDTVVIAGMGTYTILNIIKESKKETKKLIISSNNNLDILREEMIKYSYYVKEEEIVKENNKFYNIIIFTKERCRYTKKELKTGKNVKNPELLLEKNQILFEKYNNILKQIPKKKQKEILEKIEYLK